MSNHRRERLTIKLEPYVSEILCAAFEIQDARPDLAAGEVLEGYAIDTCETLFGISFGEYCRLRAAGRRIDLILRHDRVAAERTRRVVAMRCMETRA